MDPNARLLRVTEGEATQPEDYDRPGGGAGGPEKWEGSAPAFFESRRERDTTTGGRQTFLRRSITVETGRPRIEFGTDDVVEWFHKGQAHQGVVETVEADEAPPGLPGEVRLTLAPA